MIRFEKLSGAGNDFVLLDGRRAGARPTPALARRLCDRKEGVGADGLLVVTRRSGRPHDVVYLNADGSRAFCGNGTRCAAWWLSLGGAGRVLELRTDQGLVEARIVGKGRVRISMPPARRLRLGLELRAAGRSWTAHAVDTGVPHAVVLARDLAAFPVAAVGAALRRHRAFGKAGANVDFAVAEGPRQAGVRTYERGVEAETLACGTGAVAAAVVLEALGKAALPVSVRTRGGRLTVSRGEGRLWLEGPARVAFQGRVP
ncbi:MAG: diaminopimelate epimerase [Elusimicrobia bacterium]|nr:diaminopimelate epimerase [Elusimicrobiota bacterium]